MKSKKKRQVELLIALLVLLFLLNYSLIDNSLQKQFQDYEIGIVERIIDGDTIVVNNTSVRLLGINCPEKGEQYYEESKEYLEKTLLNQTVKLQFTKEKYDLYNRKLAYIYYNNENVNKELIQQGLANTYFPSGKDKYYNQFQEAWKECINQNINLCEASDNKCIILKEFNYNDEIVILQNICSNIYNLKGYTLKDEGRKKFTFPDYNLQPNSEITIKVGQGTNTKSILYWETSTYIWTNTGDTLFLRDSENKLVLFSNY